MSEEIRKENFEAGQKLRTISESDMKESEKEEARKETLEDLRETPTDEVVEEVIVKEIAEEPIVAEAILDEKSNIISVGVTGKIANRLARGKKIRKNRGRENTVI